MECWDKTAIFDQFYKSVQAAHLLLLNSKYSRQEIEKVEIKSENVCSDDLLLVEELAAEVSRCDYDVSDQSPDEDLNTNEQIVDKGKLNF